MKTTRYIYTALILAALSQGNAVAQNKGGFFGKVRDTFSTEIKIGNNFEHSHTSKSTRR